MTRLNRLKKTRRRTFDPFIAIGVFIPILFVAAVGVNIARANNTDSHTDCTVTEKEDRALASIDKRSPRIYTECGVFVVSDELLRLHFNAADVYNTLQVGGTYDLTTVGWRFGAFSWFPNIIDAEEVPK